MFILVCKQHIQLFHGLNGWKTVEHIFAQSKNVIIVVVLNNTVDVNGRFKNLIV